jgi:hypothetical protein
MIDRRSCFVLIVAPAVVARRLMTARRPQGANALFWLLCGLLIASCTPAPAARPAPLTLPTPLAAEGPAIPFVHPNLLGDAETHIRPIADTRALLSCLESGQTVYGIALQNSNVRIAPAVDACRVGRIPKGSVVEVVGAINPDDLTATRSTSTTTSTRVTFTLGYVEDVQPIFERTCNSCHSAIVKNLGLQVTDYGPLMQGGSRGTVVKPGDAEGSVLWQQVESGRMPMIGRLSPDEKALIRDWINAGAPERRQMMAETIATPPALQEPVIDLWLQVDGNTINPVSDQCETEGEADQVVSSDLVFPLSCGVAPREPEVQAALTSLAIVAPSAAPVAVAGAGAAGTGAAAAAPAEAEAALAEVAPAAAPALSGGGSLNAAQTGIQASALNLAPPADGDGWLQPRGGYCVEQRLPQNERGITALAFAPDGRLFMALDQSLTDEPDPLILYDAYHPSRSVAIYDPAADTRPVEIFVESTRITGMVYHNGALYLNRAGEVGWIPEGGKYQPLAGGFAVNSQLFHANNGLAILDGWLYVSAGGVIDGYSDGPIVGIGEAGAQNVVSAGNRFAARIVRAPLDVLVSQRSIEAFQTVARGVRNPYGLAVDPSGRIWFTDNGATNVPDNVSAGDEVNLLDARTVAPGTAEDATPYFGFPLALTANPAPDWYRSPVVALPNTSAPTAISWAYGTLFFGVYGRNPGLYRLGQGADGSVVAERVLLIWPLLSMATAPDGALWIGTGSGGLFRVAPGCG